MDWYYVDAGQQAGPVTDEQLDELLRTGKIQADTLIWREGMANWLPYSQARVPAPAAPATPAPTPSAPAAVLASAGADEPPKEAVCSECGRIFAIDEMIKHKGNFICASCKPIFFQRLREGAAPASLGTAGTATEADLLAREYDVDIGDCLSKAWEIFTHNTGLVIGTLIVAGLVGLVGGAISMVISIIVPFGRFFTQALYAVPLAAGLWWFLIRLARGETAGVGDVFAGFSAKYGQLVVFGLVQLLINILCLLPILIVVVSVFGIASFGTRGGGSGPGSGMAVGIVGGMLVAGAVSVCALAYVNVLMTFALPLIMDKGYPFWPAIRLSAGMVKRRWWMTCLFLIVVSALNIAGVCACFVGLLVTIPLGYAMRAVLYDKNFRSLMHH